MSHTCHARCCRVEVPPELLLCPRHWAMVTRSIQKDVVAEYRDGQCIDKLVTPSWLRAAHAAIGFVAMREGTPLTIRECEVLVNRGYRVSLLRELVRRHGEAWRATGERFLDECAARIGVPAGKVVEMRVGEKPRKKRIEKNKQRAS
jgi:hypothetical protein